jgi:N-acetylglucosaminyldiphosphoundecaprenol N-acetyl-beta-D-mannosaminyltransferase
MVENEGVVRIMDHWISNERDVYHHVVNTGMHGIMEGRRDPKLREILDSADLFVPDGILAITVARLKGFKVRKQNVGPDLLWKFAAVANEIGYSYFLYGDTQETLNILADKLRESFPNLRLAGMISPPFRPLTPEEDEEIVQTINEAQPDVIWVGLGMPKQEHWIFEHRDTLNVTVAVGAGAAFKLLGGSVSRSPGWLGNAGFEWLWRLIQEPKRVWRRVFLDAPQFITLALLEITRVKKFR